MRAEITTQVFDGNGLEISKYEPLTNRPVIEKSIKDLVALTANVPSYSRGTKMRFVFEVVIEDP